MFVVPVPRNEWHPTTQIKASYISMNQAEQSEDPTVSSTEAIFSINATNPSINVDNFPSIKKVECSRNDTVKLTFDSRTNLDSALAAWSKSPYLFFWLNPQYECFGSREVQSFNASYLVVRDPLTLIAVGHIADRSAMFGDFEVSLKPRHAHSKSFQVSLNMNYKHGQVVNPDQILIAGRRMYVSCTNCFLSGYMSWEFNIRSKKGVIKEYRLIQKGGMKGNIDVNMLFFLHREENLIRFSLAALPLLNPITIPGILSFGPEVSLDMAFSYELLEPFSMAFGFDFGHTYELDIHSIHGLASIPTIKRTISNIPIRAHPFNHSIDVAADLGLHLIPTVAFKLTIGGIELLKAALSFDNSIGIQIFEGKQTICKEKKEYRMYDRHSFNFDILTLPLAWKYLYPLWNSGDHYFSCPFCTNSDKDCQKSLDNLTATT